MHRDNASTTPNWTAWVIIGITLIAPSLHGSTVLPAQAALFILAGLLMLFSPTPFLKWNSPSIWLAIFWLLLAATTFLPAAWFDQHAWRPLLGNEFEIPLAPSHSPQPFLSLQAWILFAGSLAWGSFLLAQRWNSSQRRTLAAAFCLGVTALAGACLLAHFFGRESWIGGGGDARLGPFPNKNQSSHLFALAGVLAMGLFRDSIHKHKATAFVWWIPLVIILPALFNLQSRGGFAVFAVGALLLSLPRRWKGSELAGSAVIFSVLLVGTATLILFGVPLMDRLLASIGTQKSDFRFGMYRDVFQMIKDLPWNGAGLGNFADLFVLWRNETAGTFARVRHPDSDWSLMGAELGWLTFPIAILLLFAALLPAFARKNHESTWVDRAVGVAILASFFFSFIEVSAHVIGTAWPLLFLIGLAAQSSYYRNIGTGSRWVFPSFGLAMLALGSLAALSIWGPLQLKTSWAANQARTQASRAIARGDFPSALEWSSRSLAINPLSAQSYFLRGSARAGLRQDQAAALDFSRARFLEPTYPNYAMVEGIIWKNTRPLRTVAAWNETLDRAKIDPTALEQFFDRMLIHGGSPKIRPYLVDRAMQDPILAMVLLRRDSPSDFQKDLNRWRVSDPTLSRFNQQQRFRLIRLWFERGDSSELEFFLSSNHRELGLYWPIQAEIYAQRGDYEDAINLVRRYFNFPPQPTVTNEPMQKLRTDAAARPDDILPRMKLLARLVADGEFAEAVEIVSQISSNPTTPDYFYALASEAYRQTGDLPNAWKMLQVLVNNQRSDADALP